MPPCPLLLPACWAPGRRPCREASRQDRPWSAGPAGQGGLLVRLAAHLPLLRTSRCGWVVGLPFAYAEYIPLCRIWAPAAFSSLEGWLTVRAIFSTFVEYIQYSSFQYIREPFVSHSCSSRLTIRRRKSSGCTLVGN